MSKSSTTIKGVPQHPVKGVATPNRVTTHPGEVLAEEFLKPLGMSVNALAMALRVPATRIGAIVNGGRSVSADTALRLARFFGTSPEFWVNLQAVHDLTKARQESGATIARDVRPRAK
ncbi:MAG: addiction module antidote protein, HigA family [Alphaproteobacteria bacterium]|nr:addiction module antidote protein, HigA family [Alphaproteobacteria bacterium]